MEHIKKYSKVQTVVLIIIRWVLGYHFLYEGMNKLVMPGWTSKMFLLKSNWYFSDFFHFLASSETLLKIVDFLNIWGQIFIGLALIIGLFSVLAAIFGAVLLLFYYVAIPPFLEGYSFIDKNLFELFLFLITAIFSTSKILGIDLLIDKRKSKND